MREWSTRFKVVFVHIPKNAGSTVERTLDTEQSCHASASECERCNPLAWNRSYTFATVRNPLARLVSMFEYMAPDVPFNAFVQHVASEGAASRLMTRTQLSFLRAQGQSGALRVSGVLHVEDLQAEWQALSSRLPALPPQLAFASKTVHKIRIRNNATPWCSYYTDATVLALAKRSYDEDIQWLLGQPRADLPRATLAGLDFELGKGESMCDAVERASGKVRDAWRKGQQALDGSASSRPAILSGDALRAQKKKAGKAAAEASPRAGACRGCT